jgi:ubiquinone biosynthesis protein
VYYELERLARVVPQKLTDILQQMEMGRFDVHLDHRGLEPSVNRLVLGLLSSATFLGSTLLLSRGVLPVLWGVSVPGAIGTAISLVLGARALRGIRKY